MEAKTEKSDKMACFQLINREIRKKPWARVESLPDNWQEITCIGHTDIISTQQPVQHHAHANILSTQNWKDLGNEVNSISFRALIFKMLNKQYLGRTSWRYQMGKGEWKAWTQQYNIFGNSKCPVIQNQSIQNSHETHKFSKTT
jgi:hypothetical protein